MAESTYGGMVLCECCIGAIRMVALVSSTGLFGYPRGALGGGEGGIFPLNCKLDLFGEGGEHFPFRWKRYRLGGSLFPLEWKIGVFEGVFGFWRGNCFHSTGNCACLWGVL